MFKISSIVVFLLSTSVALFAETLDTMVCIESKYFKRLCYDYGPDYRKTVVTGYDEYDSLVIKIRTTDSLIAEDFDYTKMTNVVGHRFVYDDQHRLIQEIWYSEKGHLHMLIQYAYQLSYPDRISSAKIYNRITFDHTSGFYADKKQYEYLAKKVYKYKYYDSDFVILKCFEVNSKRLFDSKIFYKYEIRYPWKSMRCFVKD